MNGSKTHGWLDLKHAAEYCCLSIRTLRAFLGHPTHPLPARLVGLGQKHGKWLVRTEDLDRWLASFPKAGEDTDRLVNELLREVTDVD